MKVDKDAFEYAISKIDDGDIFEKFGTEFLSASLGYEFIPVGGSKDKGVDAFRHIFCRKHHEKIIFQLSTELDHEGKIFDTIKNLKGIKFRITNFTMLLIERLIMLILLLILSMNKPEHILQFLTLDGLPQTAIKAKKQ